MTTHKTIHGLNKIFVVLMFLIFDMSVNHKWGPDKKVSGLKQVLQVVHQRASSDRRDGAAATRLLRFTLGGRSCIK